MPYINIIVACDKNYGIGKNNNLPWKNREDMKLFTKYTIGNNKNAIIMGRKTWESLPKKPLCNRINIVLSNTLTESKDYILFDNRENLMNHIKSSSYENIWIIGGSEIYKLFINDVRYIYLTKQEKIYDCDTFFPDIPKHFKCIKIHTINDYSKLFINQNMDYHE